ncbi:hypothetical protein MNQ95_04650 [Pseudoxanthomonas daejeonensis]|uniref:hypothetical protein n=1 Tax=Pseudoxanthomonas daejeonensis TaxID=266062 RepID=UPI001F54364A|nr:hypothetical protein [Pseudoxanthomonas daejeonensis]UNK58391.1 hypothetical protein MNQ95_04650 [Pseudoxanthomonas daejeonensis]
MDPKMCTFRDPGIHPASQVDHSHRPRVTARPATVRRIRRPSPDGCIALCLAVAGTLASAAHAQEVQPAADAPNNGTDPTRLTTAAVLAYEYNDLAPDISRHAPRLELTLPFGARQDYSLRLRVPVVRNDMAGNGDFGLGDVTVMGTHVFGHPEARPGRAGRTGPGHRRAA